MKPTTLIIVLIAVSACAAVSFGTKEQSDLKYIVEKCFDKEIVDCPDKICEISTDDPYDILQQVKVNILSCIESEMKVLK